MRPTTLPTKPNRQLLESPTQNLLCLLVVIHKISNHMLVDLVSFYCCSLDGRVHQYRILPDASGLLAVQVGGQV